MASFSFDVVCDYDKAEVNNVFDQVKREMLNRYDFKATPASLDWLDDKSGFKLTGNSQLQIEAILDIIRKKLAARNVSQKLLDTSGSIVEANLKAALEVPFVSGLDQDKAKQITKLLKAKFPKLKTQIQGEAIRVSSNSKNELQAVMTTLRAEDYAFPLSFINYR